MESSSASPRLADTPIFPFQHLLDLAPLVQDLATKYIVRQRAVAPILAQCPAADFQHTRHLTVAQVHSKKQSVAGARKRPAFMRTVLMPAACTSA